jgi:hypothetical protein
MHGKGEEENMHSTFLMTALTLALAVGPWRRSHRVTRKPRGQSGERIDGTIERTPEIPGKPAVRTRAM